MLVEEGGGVICKLAQYKNSSQPACFVSLVALQPLEGSLDLCGAKGSGGCVSC